MMAEHSPFASLDKRSFPNRFLLENALGKFSKRSNQNDGQDMVQSLADTVKKDILDERPPNPGLAKIGLSPKDLNNFLSLYLYQHM